MLDYNGIVVVGGNEEGQSFAHVREVERGLAGRYTSVIRQRISDEPPPPLTSISRGTGIRIFAVYPIINKDRLWGAVYLSRTPTSILKNLYAEKTKVILAGLIILALTLFIALITSWTIARPIYRLIERTRRISRGEQVNLQPDDVPGTREMALLSKGFFDMAGALEERSSYIKQFATHVSHEFKTPLTSIKGAAELLEEHADTMSAEKRSRFLRNIMDDAERMKQLVNRLLELARADNFMPAAETAMFFQQPDDVPGTREMALLSKGFFDMAGALEERSSYIKQFATHVSHEFKTPLTSIKGAAELLEEHADTMSAEKRSRFLRNIMDDAERMKQLVNRLLELARADNFMPAAETAMLPDVLETLQKSYNASDFKLLASCSTPLEVALSAEVLTMIFSNLIDNARQHGADEVRFDMVHKGAAVELSVTDNGAGISPANAARIFDPFFTTRRERGGTGLGLGIVRSLLENHRGAIRLDRDRSRTSFIVTLPATGPAR